MSALDDEAVACPDCGSLMLRVGEITDKLVTVLVVETDETIPYVAEQTAQFQCGACGRLAKVRASY